MSLSWNVLKNHGIAFLSENGVEDASFEALQLILFVSGFSLNEYFLNMSNSVTSEQKLLYDKCLKRRVNNEPLQYIIGKWDFYNSEFYVGEGVLIPRPETEELVDLCLQAIRNRGYKNVVDLCTGSGCIGLSIAAECPATECYLVELHDKAIGYAYKNLEKLRLKNVKIINADIFDGVCDGISDIDLIVSNPPYIPSVEIDGLQKEVLSEPVTALDGGTDGLDFYRAIYEKWCSAVSEGGLVAFECGENQADIIAKIYSESFDCDIITDNYGVKRFVICVKKTERINNAYFFS